MHSFFLYFAIFFVFSIFLNLILPYHKTPIMRVDSGRLFGVISYRELLGLPISFAILCGINNYNKEPITIHTFFYSMLYMFITGIIIHAIFGVKSMLSYKLNLGERPNGTGLAPYSDY